MRHLLAAEFRVLEFRHLRHLLFETRLVAASGDERNAVFRQVPGDQFAGIAAGSVDDDLWIAHEFLLSANWIGQVEAVSTLVNVHSGFDSSSSMQSRACGFSEAVFGIEVRTWR